MGWILRMPAAPGVEFRDAGDRAGARAGNAVEVLAELGRPAFAETCTSHSSFADGETRRAFPRTLQSVAEYPIQSVNALNRLNLRECLPVLAVRAIWRPLQSPLTRPAVVTIRFAACVRRR